jgi:hypothetical protein
MTQPAFAFSPGSLVLARGREWIVLPGAAATMLRLRPLSGAETDVQVLDPTLEQDGVVPADETNERTYRLTGEFQRFFEDVLDYCAEVTERAGTDERRRRLAFWGTLALMRCVASSPAAALRALITRANLDADPLEEEAIRDRVLDGEADDLSEDDAEPAGAIEDPRLKSLID